MESMKGARRRKKWLTYFRPHTTHYRGINLLVALNDALLNPFFCFDYSFYALHEEQQRFRLHEHCLTFDLARSTHAFMHVIREIDFDPFESNNLQFFILACVV